MSLNTNIIFKCLSLLALVGVFLVVPASAQAAVSGGLKYSVIDGSARIDGCAAKKCPAHIVIPAAIKVGATSLAVTSIRDRAFYLAKRINKVVIPSSVTRIGSSAFTDNQLTRITIPSSVTSIGSRAFSYNLLSRVVVPNGVVNIGSGAFEYNWLTSVSIPASVTSIGSGAFQNNALSSVTIPAGVTSISAYAFAYNELTSINIPAGVTSIGDGAFYSNSITGVDLPASITDIGSYAFQGNPITSLSVDTSNTKFSGLNNVLFNKDQSVLLYHPEGLPGNYTVPAGVTDIGEYAFFGSHLSGVTIPEGVTHIGDGAFIDNKLTSLDLPDSITDIDSYAFFANKLNGVNIPAGVTRIGPGAFVASSMSNISVDSNNTSFSSLAGVLFNKDQTELLAYPAGKVDSSKARYTIPSSVTSVVESAFSSCRLRSVVVPATVTSIGYSAFSDCTKLHDFYFAGDAPALSSGDLPVGSVFYGIQKGAKAYRHSGAKGFPANGSKWAGLVVAAF